MSSTTTAADAEPPPPQSDLIPSLPNDISINILARIPRSQHPYLSLVSKQFHSFLSSPLCYTARSLLKTTQNFLYISLRIPTTTSVHWFTLYQNQTSPKKNFLIPLPPTPFTLVGSAFASVGPKIYIIGGSINDIPSSHVWALDCRFHTWEAVPSMKISREFPAAAVVDGNVYVVGGSVVDTWSRSKNWAEVFDPKTKKWESVESEGQSVLREKWMHGCAVMNGRIYAMADRNGVVYEPKTKNWGCVESELDLGWRGRACVVGGILYSYDYLGKIRGFDVGNRVWKELRGVDKELPRLLCGATMANLGGKLIVVWERTESGIPKEMEVWCAEIEVEKNGEGELWGRIEWCDVVHKVPTRSSIVHCLAVTL